MEKTEKENPEHVSFDMENKKIIMKFSYTTVTLPFPLVKDWYLKIIKMEEIGI